MAQHRLRLWRLRLRLRLWLRLWRLPLRLPLRLHLRLRLRNPQNLPLPGRTGGTR